MKRRIIVVGDTTTHGGVVITGAPTSRFNGQPIARLGDQVDCPERYPSGRPHGINKIIEGSAHCRIGGIPVALEGHRTECGCALIGSVRGTVNE